MRAVREQRRERGSEDAYARARTEPLREGTVLYESFAGAGVLDDPEALFRYLLSAPDLQHLEHVWALDSLSRHAELIASLSCQGTVRFVELGSRDYLHALATSKYLVNNHTFPQHFAKRPGQIYLNTWHGRPLEVTGYDREGGGPAARNIVRNFLNTDYLLSANQEMTDGLYRRAYRLENLYSGAVIEEGLPRTDRQREAQHDPDSVLSLLEPSVAPVAGRRILVFAPARSGTPPSARRHLDHLAEVVSHLQDTLGDEWRVLLTVPATHHAAVRDGLGDAGDFLAPLDVPLSLLLGVTDLLVTDASSSCFDFAAAGRPVVHYLPSTEQAPDLYLDEEARPGPTVTSLPALVDEVRRAAAAGPSSDPAPDRPVCERVVDIVFRGADESSYAVRRDFAGAREKILIHLGAMKSMGITTSGLNLLRTLDHDRYDVTAFYRWSRGPDRAKNIALVDPRVRVLPQAGEPNGSRRRLREVERMMTAEGVATPLPAEHVAFWRDEWQRMFGSSTFDILIDFSGYGAYAPFLFTVAEAEHKAQWLHNDMMADSERRMSGEKPHPRRHAAVFSTYPYFDSLVSVSPLLNEVNSTRLAPYAPPHKFTYALNTIDGERILRLASEEPVHDPSANPGATTFVTVGRLSVEKNHSRLVRAFARLHQQHPDTQLLIMGTGELHDELQELIRSLGLETSVRLLGLVDNPYAVMARSQCFVLSSDYEGQPMVILEARTLGLPVVATAFDSAADSVPPDAGIVVPTSVEGLAEGMAHFLRGEMQSKPLDTAAYNEQALEQFNTAIHRRDPGRVG